MFLHNYFNQNSFSEVHYLNILNNDFVILLYQFRVFRLSRNKFLEHFSFIANWKWNCSLFWKLKIFENWQSASFSCRDPKMVNFRKRINDFNTIMVIMFWDFYQIFFSPRVKRDVIISTNYGIYGLLHELPNNLRLRILANYERSGRPQNFIEL